MVSYVRNDVDKEELYVVSAASHHPGVQPRLFGGYKMVLIFWIRFNYIEIASRVKIK